MAREVALILNFSKQAKVEACERDIGQLLGDFQLILQKSLPDNIILDLQVEPGMGTIFSSGDQLEQIITQVCENSKESMPEGGTLSIAASQINADKDLLARFPELNSGSHLLIQIQDTGIGMDEATRERIFEPFFSTKPKGATKGVGLGMALAWQLVRKHNGIIQIKSAPKEGTRASIYLPLSKDLQEESFDEAPGTGHILIVCKDQGIGLLTNEMLNMLGYSPVLLSSIDQAEKLLSDKKVNECRALILDHEENQISSLEELSHFRLGHPEIQTIVLTSHDLGPFADMLVKEKVCSFIEKPFSIKSLAHQLHSILD